MMILFVLVFVAGRAALSATIGIVATVTGGARTLREATLETLEGGEPDVVCRARLESRDAGRETTAGGTKKQTSLGDSDDEV